MSFAVIYEKVVVNEDIPAIPKAEKAPIIRAINERIAVAPLSFGKQLSHGLTNYRSLRVGNWRIAFRVEGDKVIIAHIDRRRDAYKKW